MTARDEFLSVSNNKQQLITLIGDQLNKVGNIVIQTDANVNIIKKVVNTETLHSTTLIGEDKDLLMLLLLYCLPDLKPLYFRSDNQSRSNLKLYGINQMNHLGNKLYTQTIIPARLHRM